MLAVRTRKKRAGVADADTPESSQNRTLDFGTAVEPSVVLPEDSGP